jgi:hypothetical protein
MYSFLQTGISIKISKDEGEGTNGPLVLLPTPRPVFSIAVPAEPMALPARVPPAWIPAVRAAADFVRRWVLTQSIFLVFFLWDLGVEELFVEDLLAIVW